MGAGNVTFVTAVEAGGIERNAICMAESLRRRGGHLAEAAVVFVQPRSGPPLSRLTHERIERLGGTILRANEAPRHSWYNFLNEPVALNAAAKIARTDFICWINDDFLALDDLPFLDLGSDADFAACPSDLNLGATGLGSRYENYWVEYCHAIGVPFEVSGWIRIHAAG